MRIGPRQGPQLDPLRGKSDATAEKVGGARAAGADQAQAAAGSGGRTAAILKRAADLAKELLAEGGNEERPGSRERAQALLNRPFDAGFADQVALSLLKGEQPPEAPGRA